MKHIKFGKSQNYVFQSNLGIFVHISWCKFVRISFAVFWGISRIAKICSQRWNGSSESPRKLKDVHASLGNLYQSLTALRRRNFFLISHLTTGDGRHKFSSVIVKKNLFIYAMHFASKMPRKKTNWKFPAYFLLKKNKPQTDRL